MSSKSIAVLFVALFVTLIHSLTSCNETNSASVSDDKYVLGNVLTKNDFNTAKSITPQELYKKTVGEVSEKAKQKYKTVEEYIKARGEPSLAGKAFEALTVDRYNTNAVKTGNSKRLVSTASLNRPTDAADILLVSESGEILEIYQLKAGITSASEAVSALKYREMRVVTHPERLAELQKDLDKNKVGKLLRVKPLSAYWSKIDGVISDGRLTSEIDQLVVPTYEDSVNAGKEYVEKAFR